MADPGQKVYPRIDEARAIGTFIEGPVRISGLDWDDPDDEIELITTNVLAFELTAPSLREQGCVDTDVSFELRMPGVDQTTCDSAASVDWDGLNLAHRNNVGIYGPGPAHDHEDWTGSGGVPTPNGAGAFAVTGAGALTLDIDSNFETRLTAVPAGTADDSPPTIYMTRKADYYFADEAVREGVYCWLGWAFLRIPLTAPSACTLTLTVTSRTYTVTDNHLTDASRSDDFTWDYTESEHTYSMAVEAGAANYDVCLVTPAEGDHPRFERVVSVELSGFANGNWTLAEPTLILDPLVEGTHSQVKMFEGYEYHVGGVSAHVDAAHECLYVDEDNLGHSTMAELVLPGFCYLEGAETGYDLTTAWSLEAFAGLIERNSDAFTCSLDSDNYDDATEDEDANRLSTCYSFDVCSPEGASIPLQQDTDGTHANCSLRCGTWEAERGIVYTLRPDKVLEGRAHGRALLSDTALARDEDLSDALYRRKGGGYPWEHVQDIASDEAGHWCSDSLEEVAEYDDDDLPVRWEYALIGLTDTTDIGAVYVREFVVADAMYVSPLEPHLSEGYVTDVYLSYRVADNLYLRRRRTAAEGFGAAALLWAGQYPCTVHPLRTGEIIIAYQSGGQTHLKRTKDLGDNWEAVGVAVNGEYPLLVAAGHLQYLFTYTSGVGQVMRRSENFFSTVLSSAVVTADTNEERVGGVKLLADGRALLCAVPHNTQVKVYRSKDEGATWELES